MGEVRRVGSAEGSERSQRQEARSEGAEVADLEGGAREKSEAKSQESEAKTTVREGRSEKLEARGENAEVTLGGARIPGFQGSSEGLRTSQKSEHRYRNAERRGGTTKDQRRSSDLVAGLGLVADEYRRGVGRNE